MNYQNEQNRQRLVRYLLTRVAMPDFCAHEFSARCKRGLEWKERARWQPIPSHRAMVAVIPRASNGA